MNAIKSRLSYLLFPAIALALSACVAGEDFEYEQPDDMKPGPGLFTGEDGVYSFTIPYPD